MMRLNKHNHPFFIFYFLATMQPNLEYFLPSFNQDSRRINGEPVEWKYTRIMRELKKYR